MNIQNQSEFDSRYDLFLHAAHELNTPLTSLVMATFLLKNDKSNFENRQKFLNSVNVIERSCDRLQRTINNVILYHRLQQPNFPVYDQKLEEVHFLIKECAEKISNQLGRNGDIVFNFSLDSDVALLISREYFMVMINELIHNAFSFSGVGSKVLINYSLSNNFGVFSVTDFGIGMDKEEVSEIGAYTQFNRVILEQQGLGLGLTLVKQLTHKHFGGLKITSSKGKGTTVQLGIPVY
jgi:signal transduction histidine kinase